MYTSARSRSNSFGKFPNSNTSDRIAERTKFLRTCVQVGKKKRKNTTSYSRFFFSHNFKRTNHYGSREIRFKLCLRGVFYQKN